MKLLPTRLPGCSILQGDVFPDQRGAFTKTVHEPTFRQMGLPTDWREEYFTHSRRNVVRGMHFQVPPAAHAKLVFCVAGAVLDLVLDLRSGSPTFGEFEVFELNADTGRAVYAPVGCAHGFLSLSDRSTLYYKVETVHAPAQDAGVRWDSFGYTWPVTDPIISERDRKHPTLAEFVSPFRFDETSGVV
jgi:dTDP-4-dehydrorhamnose 3,5-epimerase